MKRASEDAIHFFSRLLRENVTRYMEGALLITTREDYWTRSSKGYNMAGYDNFPGINV